MTRFLPLFAPLNVRGMVYPPDGGLPARVLAAGALPALAAALALLGESGGRPDRWQPGE
jgi:hypothetical protein